MNWQESITSIFIVICLLGIGIQDFKFFAISWGWLPMLAILFVIDGYFQLPMEILLQDYLMSFGLFISQLFVLTLWYSIKSKKWVNISTELLGLGDILFLLVLVFSFSFVNYLVFVVSTLVVISIGFMVIRKLGLSKSNQIPLAGAMSFILIGVKTLSAVGIISNLYSNQYLWILR